MTESKPDLKPAASASRFPQSSPHRYVVRHSRALEGAIYALLQAARILSEAAESSERRLNDAELEALAGQMIQDLIFNLNHTKMFYYEQNFRQLLGFTRGYQEDTGNAFDDDAPSDALLSWLARNDSFEGDL